jgi:hypothetical protein
MFALDGGRCYVPLPDREFEDGTLVRLKSSRKRSDFIKMVNAFTSTFEYESFITQSKIQLVDDPWMT